MSDKNKKPLKNTIKSTKEDLSQRVSSLDKKVLKLVRDVKEDLDQIGENVLGEDFYGEAKGSEDWKNLSMADRNKLRIGFAMGLLSDNIIEDFRKNPYLIALAIGPGPIGTIIAVALLASYTVRTDERGKELRAKISEMLDSGVQLEDYKDVLRPKQFDPSRLEVDNAALLKKKWSIIQNGSTKATQECLEKCSKLYTSFKNATGEKIGKAVKYTVTPALGPDTAEKTVESMTTGYEFIEDSTATGYEHSVKGVKWAGHNIAKPVLRESFEMAQTVHEIAKDLAEQSSIGIEDIKNELKDIISRFKLL